MTRDALLKALDQHRANLAQLEVQAAQYGAGQEPLWLANALRAERAAIEDLEEALEQLEAPAKETAASAAVSQRRRTLPMVDLSMTDLGNKIDAVRDDIHRLDLRLTRVEADLDNLRRALVRNGHNLDATIPRWIVFAGGILSLLTLALLILLSVRVW